MRPGGADELRRALLEQFQMPPSAWSVDGRVFLFRAGFEDSLQVGGYVRITTSDGRTLLGQVDRREPMMADLGEFEVDLTGVRGGAEDSALSSVKRAVVRLPARFVQGHGNLLAEVRDGELGPIRSAGGFADAPIVQANDTDVSALVRAQIGAGSALDVGYVALAPEASADLRAAGFGRHTFLCGQSGSGKTFSLGIILERLLLHTDLRLVVLDPNSDHVHLPELRPLAEVNRLRRTPLSEQEYAELEERYRSVAAGVRVARAGKPPWPLKVWFSDLTTSEQALALHLDPLRDIDEFHAFARLADELAPARYTVEDVYELSVRRLTDVHQALARRIQNLGVALWSVWAHPGAESGSGLEGDWRAIIVDLGSLSDPAERRVVSLVLLGYFRRRADRTPTLIVLDEAHHVCPPDPIDELQAAACEHTIWIAGEGRKYGDYLLVSTQRPQKIHRNVLSQCDNLLLMRVNSEADLAMLAEVFSHVGEALIAEATTFTQGEALAAGPIAPVPLRLRIDGRLSPEGGSDIPADWATA